MLSLGLSAQLSITVEKTNVSCYGGSDGTGEVTSVFGGVPPYTYQWTYNDLTPITDSTNSTISGLPEGTYFVFVYDVDSSNSKAESINILDGINIAILPAYIDDVTCNGADDGKITVNAGGGNPPRQYSINGGVDYQSSEIFDSLSGGNYNIVVLDSKGCTKVYPLNPVEVKEPNPLVASLDSKTNIDCFGDNDGEIDVSISGGSTPYVTEWTKDGSYFDNTEDIFPLPPGEYTLSVEDNNTCTADLGPITIEEAPEIIISNVIATPESCFDYSDGEVLVTASGGTDPLKYILTPTSGPDIINNDGDFTGLKGDTYTLSVTDANNCGPVFWAGGNIIVNNPPVVEVNKWDTTNITCNGANNGIIEVSGKGGTPPYKYMLNPDMTPSTDGIFNGIVPGTGYFVEVTDDNDCPADATPTLDFTEPDPIVITVDSTSDVTCNGDGDGTIYVSATGGSGSYLFTLTPPTGPTINNTDGTFTGLSGGTFSVSVKDSKGCGPDVAGGISLQTRIRSA